MIRSSRENFRTLLAVAHEQGGYFTAKQARQAGYGYPHLDYHTSTGTFERVDHGLYRVAAIPRAEHDELIRLSLWSRDREDRPQAVVSHESALALHDLSELLPTETHLTVPRKFRKTTPSGCVLHKADIMGDEIEEREGFRVTGPLRTLLDVARGGVSQEQLTKAVSDALSRGLVRRRKLAEALGSHPGSDRLRAALTEAG